MTEYRFWIRERGRSRNKWHVSQMHYPAKPQGGLPPFDHAACGQINYIGISASEYETQELPNGTLPTDASGVCLHCVRWCEVQERKGE